MDRQLYTRIEAAHYLRISVSQLDGLARRGTLARCKIGTGPRARVLYRRQDLDAFVARHMGPDRVRNDADTESP